MNKAELIIKGRASILYDTLEEAMEAGRQMRRAGDVVRIEVFPEVVPGLMTGYRFDDATDAWAATELPIKREP